MSDTVMNDDQAEGAQRDVLQLDARRREMLELMGVRLWWPEPKAPAAVQARAAAEPESRAEPSAAPMREAQSAPEPMAREAAQAPVSTQRPAAPPARVPKAPVAAERTPPARGGEGLLADAPRLLYGQPGTGGWLIVADLPPDMLGGYPEPLAGDEGRLLANMLRALRLDAGQEPVHLLRVHRGGAASGDDMPRPLEHVLAPQCAPLAPRVVLALGPLAAQALLQRTGPIGKLRGEAQPLPDGPMAGTPAVASYPLAFLLRNGPDKAKAWADLCLAAAQVPA